MLALMAGDPRSLFDLAGRTALVTGSSQGIGREIALRLAEVGARVIVHGRNAANCEATADMIAAAGGDATVMTADVTDKEQVQELFARVATDVGPVDVLVNNAGAQRVAWFDQMSEEDWDLVVTTNLKGPFLCSQAFVPQMREHRYGRIVNIGSEGALVGSVGNAQYVAAKAGLMGLTMNVALEMAIWGRKDPGDYTCNLVHPGYNESRMGTEHSAEQIERVVKAIPLGRPSRTRDELGSVVAFLASTHASYITGAKFSAGGGLHMSLVS
jgi:3-oxoacyl-[acyl-carrier protein] reductase